MMTTHCALRRHSTAHLSSPWYVARFLVVLNVATRKQIWEGKQKRAVFRARAFIRPANGSV